MKSVLILFTVLMSQQAFASFKECNAYLKIVQSGCKMDIRCQANTMRVADFDIIDTGHSVSCAGDVKKSRESEDSKGQLSQKKKKTFQFR